MTTNRFLHPASLEISRYHDATLLPSDPSKKKKEEEKYKGICVLSVKNSDVQKKMKMENGTMKQRETK